MPMAVHIAVRTGMRAAMPGDSPAGLLMAGNRRRHDLPVPSGPAERALVADRAGGALPGQSGAIRRCCAPGHFYRGGAAGTPDARAAGLGFREQLRYRVPTAIWRPSGPGADPRNRESSITANRDIPVWFLTAVGYLAGSGRDAAAGSHSAGLM